MAKLIITRLAGAAVTIALASLIAFVLVRVLPGDPAREVLGNLASPQAVHSLRHSMGLDRPLYVQYYRYVSALVHGDWGFSYNAGVPVKQLIGSRLPATLELAFFAFAWASVAAVVVALATTYRQRRGVDATVSGVTFFGLGTPPFWFALVLLLVFSQTLHLLPGPEGRLSSGLTAPPTVTGFYTVDALLAGQVGTAMNAVEHLILPALALGLVPFAFLVRLLRSNLREEGREDFVIVLRAKGLTPWATFARHVLPNACLSTLTVGGLLLADLMTGAVLVEKVFDWPGVGALVVDSVSQQDFAVVQALIFLSAICFVVMSLLIDILLCLIDPRLRGGHPVNA